MKPEIQTTSIPSTCLRAHEPALESCSLRSVGHLGILKAGPRRREECSWVLEPGSAGVKILAPQLMNCALGPLSLQSLYNRDAYRYWEDGMRCCCESSVWCIGDVLSTLAIWFCCSCGPPCRELVIITTECPKYIRVQWIYGLFSPPS